MAKTQRALDTWAQQIVDQPAYYSVCLFLGVGRYDKRRAGTLGEARTLGAAMAAGHPDVFSRPMIYAVSAQGNSIHVA